MFEISVENPICRTSNKWSGPDPVACGREIKVCLSTFCTQLSCKVRVTLYNTRATVRIQQTFLRPFLMRLNFVCFQFVKYAINDVRQRLLKVCFNGPVVWSSVLNSASKNISTFSWLYFMHQLYFFFYENGWVGRMKFYLCFFDVI